MRGIIYCKSSSINGNEQLKEIVDRYNKAHIATKICHYKATGSYAEFENGDIWKVVRASDSARGQCCNIAYVERSIDYDTYRVIIRPTIKNLPYTAIHLWGEGNLHITDNIIPQLPF